MWSTIINLDTFQQLLTAFATIFVLFAIGYISQYLQPLSELTLAQLSKLLIEILLPLALFFIMATTPLETLNRAPVGIMTAVLITFLNFVVATLMLRPAKIAPKQLSTFRFLNMQTNVIFLGLPICVALFGPIGAVFSVLYEFGKNLVILTFGIWVLKGGRLGNWRLLILNPLIWGIIAGLIWSFFGWPFPSWATAPFEAVGNATWPLALLISGAQLRNLHLAGTTLKRQLVGFTLTRLVIMPLIVGTIFDFINWQDTFTNVIITQASQPVGFTATIFARNYGADADFAASAVLWSTLTSAITIPMVALLYNFI